MQDVGPIEFGPHILLQFLRPKIIAGIACYGVATTSWLVILSKTPLSLAYPLISISYVIIVLLGRFHFHEPVSLFHWLGVLLICSGVAFIGFGSAPRTPPPALSTAPTTVHAATPRSPTPGR